MSSLDNGSVLADVTGSMEKVTVQEGDPAKRSREAGWAEPQKFNYDVYNAGFPNKEEKAAAQGIEEVDWAGNAEKYEWQGDYGDIGPRHEALEDVLFRNDFINRTGLQYEKLAGINVTFESVTKVKPVLKFEDAGLHPAMVGNIELCQYKSPTPIQAYVLPSVLKGIDIIGVAQTGSGKTAAYLIPTISKLMGKAKKLAAARPDLTRPWTAEENAVRAEPLILVVAPARELATQIFDEARRLCYRSMLRPCVIYGGGPVKEQMDELKKGCDVLIATPGRLIDFMGRPNLLTLSRVKYTIIDEADEMVSADWLDDMNKIMDGGDTNEDADHVYMMFSATFPKEARTLAKDYMSPNHIRIRVGRAGSAHMNVTQNIVYAEESMKRECLFDLLLSMPPSRTMVFVNNKKAADFLDDFLYNRGMPSTSIHSDRTQREREDAIRAFKSGKAPILVATDVAGRGLDIKHVMHVVNYDLPSADYGGIAEYVHRIGRTARIGNVGLATSFYNTDKNAGIAESLVKLLLETNQIVPDFLEEFKPADVTKLDFDDESDNEGEEDQHGGDSTAQGDSAGAEWSGPAKADAPPADTWETPAGDDSWNNGGDTAAW